MAQNLWVVRHTVEVVDDDFERANKLIDTYDSINDIAPPTSGRSIYDFRDFLGGEELVVGLVASQLDGHNQLTRLEVDARRQDGVLLGSLVLGEPPDPLYFLRPYPEDPSHIVAYNYSALRHTGQVSTGELEIHYLHEALPNGHANSESLFDPQQYFIDKPIGVE